MEVVVVVMVLGMVAVGEGMGMGRAGGSAAEGAIMGLLDFFKLPIRRLRDAVQ